MDDGSKLRSITNRSTFGFNNGRVSKLAIGKTYQIFRDRNFFDQVCFHYDRGFDFCNENELSADLFASIINVLENLPLLNLN